ncbi:mono/diheme cytochrome c family protein [Alkalihalobacillus xiaoxiensis]|uniref:Mono/diheme cytochrome c family protein n=1 Tax=Shouchella xiaoxiensis TaxID=766895 RepID=A0ABS2SZ20_9BACI|nr:cytochrome c [Shouchella xiaoxiensis]MBM7840451.1 mono/diheme cytochrome c family protein [Shouchella xiaoxiensis]
MKVIVCLFLLFILTGCQTNKEEEELPELKEINIADEGYSLYQDNSCIQCHGDQLQGASGPALQDLDLTEFEIVSIIEEGIGFMPPQELSDPDKTTLAKWLSEQ